MALAHHQLATTIVLFGAAALSDAADGFLAKRFGWQSELGAVLDPAADKLLLATVFVTLAYLKLVPLWLMAAAVARDADHRGRRAALPVLHRTARQCVRPSSASSIRCARPHSSWRSSAGRRFSVPPAWVVTLLGALVFVTVAVSGIDYVLIYGRRALSLAKPRAAARAGDRPP